MSAAFVAASASAIDLLPAHPAGKVVDVEPVKSSAVAPRSMSAAKFGTKLDAQKKVATRADEAFLFYRPASNVWALGNSTKGWGYQGITFGFASSVNDIVFENLSTGATDFKWDYTEPTIFHSEEEEFVDLTSEDTNLVVKGGIGEMKTPVLNSGSESYVPDYYSEYICGGGGSYWFRTTEEKGTYGVTPYQNYGMKDPRGYTGYLTYDYSYNTAGEKDAETGADLFNENGVYVGWQADFEGMAQGQTVTDIKMLDYSFFIPQPGSTYMMSRAWTGLNVSASKDTQLISYIYKVGDDGAIEENPIAIGYASIVKGSADEVDENYMPVFEYFLLNEDGDELEEPIFIDSAVVITVEGFCGNDAIYEVCPVGGYYPFSYSSYSAGNKDLLVAPTLYMRFSLKLDGEPIETLQYGGGIYYYNQNRNPDGSFVDPEPASMHAYHQMVLDAVFPFMFTASGDNSVAIPAEGGVASVDLESYFGYVEEYMEGGYYTLSAPEWLNVEIAEMDEETGLSTLTVSAEASEAGREGDVVIDGLGVTFTLHVVQGEGAAVSTVSVEKGAQYFDLQGRRVANPEKGIFIKKTGNKAEKVIL